MGLQSQAHGEGASELGLSKSLLSPLPPRGGLQPSRNTAGSSWGAVTKQGGAWRHWFIGLSIPGSLAKTGSLL